MQSSLITVDAAIRPGLAGLAGTPAGTFAARAADLQFRGSGTVMAGAAPSTGDAAVFFRPVLAAPAVICRDGTVKARAWLPGHVRLGEMERHLGDGVIEAIVDAAVAAGRPRQRRRLLSYPLVIRLMIAMTLMPQDPYCGVMAALAGLLAGIPFVLEWHVPTGTACTGWRMLIPAGLLEEVFWHAAGTLVDAGDPDALTLAGKRVQASDGTLVNLAGTQENRKAFGSAGTADGSPAPDRRADREGRARAARRRHGQVRPRRADPPQVPGETPPAPVQHAGDLLWPAVSRPEAGRRDPRRGRRRHRPRLGDAVPADGP